jgi:hypothetical protein
MQQEEGQRDDLEALIQLEVARILEMARLERNAGGTHCAALGCSFGEVWAQARKRVLEQI